MDKLDSLRVFSAVARYGSFVEAARQLSISRSMVSKHIMWLEDKLEVRLIHRTTRKLRLSEAGAAYLEHVNTILAELDNAEAAISSLHTEPRGTLKIMAPPSFGAFHLTRAVVDYQKVYPEVRVQLMLANRIPDLLEEGMDMAVVFGDFKDSNLVVRRIASSRMALCATPSYLAKYGCPKHPNELISHHCLEIFPHADFNTKQWQFTIGGRQQHVPINGALHSNAADALRIAALKGGGLVQLPTYIVGLDIRSKRLQVIMEEYEPRPVSIYMVYLHRKHLSTKVRTFTDFVYKGFHREDWAQ